jgi:hypothetical protein
MEIDSWLLTWTTYGTWLPGDERGFVGNVVEEPANDAIHSANVVRAADASRRVSFNMLIKNAEPESPPSTMDRRFVRADNLMKPADSCRRLDTNTILKVRIPTIQFSSRRRQSAAFFQRTDIDK